ncbi:MAG: DNA polymerase III subunit delta' [Proteobacteria bacterium]|nr:DNA polymerase III subunit delta' [Pseudomonadota bacterium]
MATLRKPEEPPTFLEPRLNPYLIGHENAEREFLAAWDSGRLAHAWLLAGPRGIGKATLAYRMARYALAQSGSSPENDMFGAPPKPTSLAMSPEDPVFRRVASMGHADFRVVERPWSDSKQTKRKTVIGVDDVREIGGFLSMTPSEGGWRAIVIDAADEMNPNAANAVLKVLEEPPERALLFLVAHNADRLLPTIRSRCRKLDLRPLREQQVTSLLNRYSPDIPPKDVAALAVLGDGSIGRALELSDEGGVELFRDLMTLLGDVPKLNAGKLHSLSDQALRGDAFRTLSGLLGWWLARIVTAGARGMTDNMSEIVPGERTLARRLLAAAPPAVWAEVWDKIGHLARRTEAINLDRKRSLMLMLWSIEQAVAKAPAAA